MSAFHGFLFSCYPNLLIITILIITVVPYFASVLFMQESMKMMGLNNWLHWLAWFVKYFIFISISVAIETVFFVISTGQYGSVISYISPSVLFCFLIAYSLATITFCFAASTFFSHGL